jgi:hypothetical protein
MTWFPEQLRATMPASMLPDRSIPARISRGNKSTFNQPRTLQGKTPAFWQAVHRPADGLDHRWHRQPDKGRQ